jgi:CDP-paratose 2-epimerase
VNAFLLARKNIEELSGQAFNIGGGSENTISLLELMDILQDLGEHPRYGFSAGRIGDQKYYVSDYSRFKSRTGWSPKVGLHRGIGALMSWMRQAQQEQQNPNSPILSHAS